VIPDKGEREVTAWTDMPPGEKQAWLLGQALDRKREILSLPLPDETDDSAEAHRARSLVLAAADSTINQTIALRSAALGTASDARDAELPQFIEERRQKAAARIAKMREEPIPEESQNRQLARKNAN
jgi:hypothetical protein